MHWPLRGRSVCYTLCTSKHCTQCKHHFKQDCDVEAPNWAPTLRNASSAHTILTYLTVPGLTRAIHSSGRGVLCHTAAMLAMWFDSQMMPGMLSNKTATLSCVQAAPEWLTSSSASNTHESHHSRPFIT